MTATKRCVCGNELKNMMAVVGDDLPPEEQCAPYWVHVSAAPRCTTPAPVDNVFPANKDRARLSNEIAKLHIGINRAGHAFTDIGESVRELKDALDGVFRDVEVVRTTRRATLNQVWDKLVEGGHMAAAQVVRDMVKAHDKGDWS